MRAGATAKSLATLSERYAGISGGVSGPAIGIGGGAHTHVEPLPAAVHVQTLPRSCGLGCSSPAVVQALPESAAVGWGAVAPASASVVCGCSLPDDAVVVVVVVVSVLAPVLEHAATAMDPAVTPTARARANRAK